MPFTEHLPTITPDTPLRAPSLDRPSAFPYETDMETLLDAEIT